MESEKLQLAWQEFVRAAQAHKGHGTDGQGSPITHIVLTKRAGQYEAITRAVYPDYPKSK